jgi:hypothetical protein
MDVVQGNFAWDSSTGKPVGQTSGKREYLDPEIAGEGTKVIMSDGSSVTYNPPPIKPSIPDWSTFKSIQKYFNRLDYFFFPTHVYHPDGRDEIAKDAQEAGDKYGIQLKKRTVEERMQFGGGEYRWEFAPDSPWRTQPYAPPKFDPIKNLGAGKNYIPKPPDPKIAQHELVADLMRTVVPAVVEVIKGGAGNSAPSHIDPKEWDAFLAFQAFKKTQEALEPVVRRTLTEEEPTAASEDERSEWVAKAREAGIKIDGRWKLEKLRKAVMKELERRVREAAQVDEVMDN